MPQLNANETVYSQVPQSYVELRVNIDFKAQDRELKTIAVTSAGRGEGRTTSAVNLAIAYAQAGKKTILVDADIRNPGVHLYFGEPNQRGLTNILNRTSEAAKAVSLSGMKNLSLLYAGPEVDNGSDLLSSQEMDELLQELKREFDIIILDAPPVIGHIDSKIISAKSNGVVFVVQHGSVKRWKAKRAKDELERVKVHFLGVLMNRDRTAKG